LHRRLLFFGQFVRVLQEILLDTIEGTLYSCWEVR